MKTLNTWDKENDYMLFESFKEYLKATKDKNTIYGVELYITAGCNQKCEYCYIIKYGDKLYPKEYDKPEIILKNLDIFLNYLLEEDLVPSNIDIFSGEIWQTPFGIKIFERLLEFAKDAEGKFETLMIPSNFSFILDDEYRVAIEKIIEAFSYYGVSLVFSCSYDGPLLEESNRPFKGSRNSSIKTTEEYVDFLFNWCKKYHYGFHPMVNAYSIEKWPEQMKWWVDKLVEYDLPFYGYSMFLEVRNDEWTDAKIESYLKYLNFSMDYILEKVHKNNLVEYIKNNFDIEEDPMPQVYKNYNFQNYTTNGLNKGCSVDRMMCMRLGDLAWVPCHRTSYEKFVFGRLKTEDNKIVGMQALNIPLFVGTNGLSYKGHMKCDICPIGKICQRGCFGAQFEASKEIYYPCESVCHLNFAKMLFLKEKYYQLYFKDHSEKDVCRRAYEYISSIVDDIPQEEKEKWQPIISKILSQN